MTEKTQRELEAIFQHASIGIAFTRNRTFTRCNTFMEDTLGYGQGELIGLPSHTLFSSPEDYAQFADEAKVSLLAGNPFNGVWTFPHKHGHPVTCKISAKAINPSPGDEGTVWLLEDVSKAVQQARELAHTTAALEAVMKNAPFGIIFTANRVVTHCNDEFCRMFGYTAAPPLGLHGRMLFGSEGEYEKLARIAAPLLSEGKPVTVEIPLARQDRSLFWAQLIAYPLNKADPSQGTIWLVSDRSKEKALDEAMRSALFENQAVFNSANVSIISTDIDGQIRLMNATAERWLGYSSQEMIGKQTPAILHDFDEVCAYAAQLSAEMGAAVAPGFEVFICKAVLQGSDEREWTYIRKDGSRFPVHLTTSALRDQTGAITGYIGIGIDITDRRRADDAIHQANEILENRVTQRTAELAHANQQLIEEVVVRRQVEDTMRHMAHFDALTGLPNRNLLNDRLEQALEMARRNQHRVGVLFIDLDHFKNINDSLGHHVGDLLLSQVASRMSYTLRGADTLGRLGGDEFLLLVPEVNESGKLAVIANKLIEVLSQPFSIQSHLLHVTPSIGICCYPEHGADRETLLRNADTAMYHAKASGRKNFQFFSSKLNVEVDNRFQIETALRYALNQNELHLHYQPLIDNRSLQICGVEALLRWNSKTLGSRSPAQFIPIAEDSGLIVPIGAWVLREACIQMRQWRDLYQQDLTLAVNLSPLQFRQPDLVEMIGNILNETGYPPEALELEITESSLMHNISDVVSTLQQLVALGVRLSIDDFGTGYSSLAYLKYFPVNKLKIDQSFVRDLGNDRHSVGIIETILALANTLGLDAIAEGVETEYQHQKLVELGCRYSQGYLFHKPMPAVQFAALMGSAVFDNPELKLTQHTSHRK